MRLLLLFLILATGVFAGDKNEIPKGYKPPDCGANLYSWNGEEFECLSTDRIEILTTQRDLNFKALTACRTENDFLRSRAELEQIYQKSRTECAKLGRQFNELAAMCGKEIGQ